MDIEHAAVAVASLGLLAVAVLLVLAGPTILGDETGGINEARLADFETVETYCGAPNATGGGTLSKDVPGGQRLFVNETISVPGPDAQIDARLDSWGPGRHTLALTRVPGNASGERATDRNATETNETATPAAEDCDYVRQYNATVEFARDTDWTLLITYDGELVGAHWHEGESGGSFDTSPVTPTARNATRTATATSGTATPTATPGGDS